MFVKTEAEPSGALINDQQPGLDWGVGWEGREEIPR